MPKQNKKTDRKSPLLYIMLLLCIAVVVYWRQVFNLAILSYGDWRYLYTQTSQQLFSIPYIWDASRSFGQMNLILSNYPFNILMGILSHLNIGFPFIERVVFIFPGIFCAPVFSFLLVKKVAKSNMAAFIGSLVFSYNIYMLILATGVFTILVAVSFIPLAFFLYILCLEKQKVYLSIFTGLTIFIISVYEFRIFYICIILLFFYLIYYLTIINKNFDRKYLLRTICIGIFPFVIGIMLNFYWLFPLYKSKALLQNPLFNRGLFGNTYLNLPDAVNIFIPWWTGSKLKVFEVQTMPIYFWVTPVAAFLGLWVNRKNKNILFFGVVAIIGIILSKQVDNPFPDLYEWLYIHFPGFNAFREASKFFSITALGYSVLTGGLIAWLWSNWRKNIPWKNYAKYLIVLIIIFFTLYNTKPLINASIQTTFIPRHVPGDYLVFKSFIQKQPEYFRTLWFPTYSRWSYYDLQHPVVSAADEVNSNWFNFAIYRYFNFDTNYQAISAVSDKFGSELLNEYQIKYLIVPLQDTANEDDFFTDYGTNRNFFIRNLDKLSYLRRIDIGTKDTVIYENTMFKANTYFKPVLPQFYEGEWTIPDIKETGDQKDPYYDPVLDKEHAIIHKQALYNLSTNLDILSNWNKGKKPCNDSVTKNILSTTIKECSFKDIVLDGNSRYILDMHYQGKVGYTIFSGTTIISSQTLQSASPNFYYTQINTTSPVDNQSIAIYTYTTQSSTDTPSLIKIPSPDDWYLLINKGNLNFDSNPTISYKLINPALKTITISNASLPFFLTMSEGYDPGWKLILANSKANNTLQDSIHYKYYDSLNAWYIDIPTICSQPGICSKNQDGTYNLNMNAQFTPQKLLDIGFISSLGILTIVLIILIYALIRKR